MLVWENITCDDNLGGVTTPENETESYVTRCNDISYSVPPLMILCVISTIINIKVLICAFWIRHPQTPTLLISLSLALADALASAFNMVALLLGSYLPCFNVHAPYEMRIVVEVGRLSGLLVTVGHLLALSCNHYMGILKPLHHHTLITTGKVFVVLVMLWVLPTAFISSYFISDRTAEFMGRIHFRITLSSLFFIPVMIMCGIYIHILIAVKRQQKLWTNLSRNGSTRWKAVKTSSSKNNIEQQQQRQMKGNVRAIKTTLFILGSCVIGWFPAIMIFTIMCNEGCLIGRDTILYIDKCFGRQMFVVMWLKQFFLIMKTMVNPIIYTIRMSEIQEGKRRMNAALEAVLCPTLRESRNYLFNANNRTEVTQVKRIASLHSFKTNTSIRHKSISPTELLNTLL